MEGSIAGAGHHSLASMLQRSQGMANYQIPISLACLILLWRASAAKARHAGGNEKVESYRNAGGNGVEAPPAPSTSPMGLQPGVDSDAAYRVRKARYDKAHDLLELYLQQENMLEADAIREALELLEGNMSEWGALEETLGHGYLHDDDFMLMIRAHVIRGQMLAVAARYERQEGELAKLSSRGSGRDPPMVRALEEFEYACPMLWKVQLVSAAGSSRAENSNLTALGSDPFFFYAMPSSWGPPPGSGLAGGSLGAPEDDYHSCYAVLADLYSELQLHQQQHERQRKGKGADLMARYMVVRRQEEDREKSDAGGEAQQLNKQGLKLRRRTWGMVDRLALLSTCPADVVAASGSDSDSPYPKTQIIWNEAQVMRAHMLDIVWQLSAVTEPWNAQACVERAKIWLGMIRQRSQARMAYYLHHRQAAGGGADKGQGPRLGGKVREMQAAAAATVVSEGLQEEGNCYLGALTAVAEKGWEALEVERGEEGRLCGLPGGRRKDVVLPGFQSGEEILEAVREAYQHALLAPRLSLRGFFAKRGALKSRPLGSSSAGPAPFPSSASSSSPSSTFSSSSPPISPPHYTSLVGQQTAGEKASPFVLASLLALLCLLGGGFYHYSRRHSHSRCGRHKKKAAVLAAAVVKRGAQRKVQAGQATGNWCADESRGACQQARWTLSEHVASSLETATSLSRPFVGSLTRRACKMYSIWRVWARRRHQCTGRSKAQPESNKAKAQMLSPTPKEHSTKKIKGEYSKSGTRDGSGSRRRRCPGKRSELELVQKPPHYGHEKQQPAAQAFVSTPPVFPSPMSRQGIAGQEQRMVSVTPGFVEGSVVGDAFEWVGTGGSHCPKSKASTLSRRNASSERLTGESEAPRPDIYDTEKKQGQQPHLPTASCYQAGNKRNAGATAKLPCFPRSRAEKVDGKKEKCETIKSTEAKSKGLEESAMSLDSADAQEGKGPESVSEGPGASRKEEGGVSTVAVGKQQPEECRHWTQDQYQLEQEAEEGVSEKSTTVEVSPSDTTGPKRSRLSTSNSTCSSQSPAAVSHPVIEQPLHAACNADKVIEHRAEPRKQKAETEERNEGVVQDVDQKSTSITPATVKSRNEKKNEKKVNPRRPDFDKKPAPEPDQLQGALESEGNLSYSTHTTASSISSSSSSQSLNSFTPTTAQARSIQCNNVNCCMHGSLSRSTSTDSSTSTSSGNDASNRVSKVGSNGDTAGNLSMSNDSKRLDTEKIQSICETIPNATKYRPDVPQNNKTGSIRVIHNGPSGDKPFHFSSKANGNGAYMDRTRGRICVPTLYPVLFHQLQRRPPPLPALHGHGIAVSIPGKDYYHDACTLQPMPPLGRTDPYSHRHGHADMRNYPPAYHQPSPYPVANYESSPQIEPSATRPAQAVDRKEVEDKLRRQLHYYFSPENLKRDYYLRSKMDGQGWVMLAEVAQFNRTKHLLGLLGFQGEKELKGAPLDFSLLLSIVAESPKVEVQIMPTEKASGDGNEGRLVYKIRPRENPKQWVLPS